MALPRSASTCGTAMLAHGERMLARSPTPPRLTAPVVWMQRCTFCLAPITRMQRRAFCSVSGKVPCAASPSVPPKRCPGSPQPRGLHLVHAHGLVVVGCDDACVRVLR